MKCWCLVLVLVLVLVLLLLLPLRGHPRGAYAAQALPLCGAALTFFAAAKKVSKESGLTPPALVPALTFTHKPELLVLPEDPIHRGDLVQGQKSAPHDGRSGRSVMLTIQIATEPGDPQHNLSQ